MLCAICLVVGCSGTGRRRTSQQPLLLANHALSLNCDNPIYALMAVGDTTHLVASQLRRGPDGVWRCQELSAQSVRWSSTKKSVATVTQEGLVTAVGPGSTTLKVRLTEDANSELEREFRVLPAVSALRWNTKAVSVAVGDTIRLFASAIGSDGNVLERLIPLAVTEGNGRSAEIIKSDNKLGVLIAARQAGRFQLLVRVGARADTATITVVGPGAPAPTLPTERITNKPADRTDMLANRVVEVSPGDSVRILMVVKRIEATGAPKYVAYYSTEVPVSDSAARARQGELLANRIGPGLDNPSPRELTLAVCDTASCAQLLESPNAAFVYRFERGADNVFRRVQ
jgi:hypothetical protein